MRNIRYGAFVDFMPPVYEPFGLIGEHIYSRNAQEESLKTYGYEYYVVDENGYTTIKDVSTLEKILARAKFAISFNKKEVVGIRNGELSKRNPYNHIGAQLGVKLDENGHKIKDTAYYAKKTKVDILKEIKEELMEYQEKLEKENETQIQGPSL